MKFIDLTGKKFGNLTVIKRGGNYIGKDGKPKDIKWVCRCACGNIKEIAGTSLKRGITTSCGCKTEYKPKKDLTGCKYGKLTVIERTKERRGIAVVYLCKCECGKVVKVMGTNLTRGNTKSCGCLNRLNFEKISDKGPKKTCYKGTRIYSLTNKVCKGHRTGVRGVTFDEIHKKYHARIFLSGKEYNLGTYNSLEEAKEARKKGEEEIWQPVIEEYEKEVKNDN